MMNYVAFRLTDHLLQGPMARPDRLPITLEIAPSAYLPALFPRPMRLHVYLPPRYGEFAMRYPVVYLLHPWGADEHYWTEQLGLPAVADRLIHAGAVPPFIAAIPISIVTLMSKPRKMPTIGSSLNNFHENVWFLMSVWAPSRC